MDASRSPFATANGRSYWRVIKPFVLCQCLPSKPAEIAFPPDPGTRKGLPSQASFLEGACIFAHSEKLTPPMGRAIVQSAKGLFRTVTATGLAAAFDELRGSSHIRHRIRVLRGCTVLNLNATHGSWMSRRSSTTRHAQNV